MSYREKSYRKDSCQKGFLSVRVFSDLQIRVFSDPRLRDYSNLQIRGFSNLQKETLLIPVS